MSDIQIEFTEKGHKYEVNGKRVPSVTTILGATTDKSGPLTHWAANTTLEGIVKITAQAKGRLPYPQAFDPAYIAEFESEDEWASDVAKRIKFLLTKRRLTFSQTSSDAADRGTAIHKVQEVWATNREIAQPVDFPAAHRGYVRAGASFIVDHAPEFLAAEIRLGSVQHGYAGTMDAELRFTRECENEGCPCHGRVGQFGRIDYKTSKAVYPIPNFPQLDAYEIAAREMGRDRADFLAVVRLGVDGTYEIVRSKAAHGCFLPFVDAYRSLQRIEASAK